MNVLIIGSGGREHALAWAIDKSPLLDMLFCAPGNGGMAQISSCLDINPMDFDGIVAACRQQDIKFVIIGPEDPLAAGLADRLATEDILAFGPSAAAAQLESSKAFTKDLCREAGIPTAAYSHFDNAQSAREYLQTQSLPIVIKADGLAAGKGVIIAETLDEAILAVDEMFCGAFGEAGAEVVIEEFMKGEEASFFALCDGQNILPLATAQDHKRVGEGDQGHNTGGMGAYSPAPVMTPALIEATMERIIRPTVNAMQARGCSFQGVLYAGLMITRDGPSLIEYNARFGDPETQVLAMRLTSDLLSHLLATARGTLIEEKAEWRAEAALTVVMAAKGYPGTYEKGSPIGGLDVAGADDNVEIFHAGTKSDGKQILSNGGRVLNVTALGASVAEAQSRAYKAASLLDWPQGFYRRDIGWRAVQRETDDG